MTYTVVGAFVLVLGAALIAGVLWLGSGRPHRVAHDAYVVYLTESVAGLNPRAPVRYHGVAVGSVREIALDTRDPSRVRLVLDVERGTPIREDTVAVLAVQGLTGIAYLDLSGGSPDSPPLVATPGEPVPVIRSAPSIVSRLVTGVTTLLANLDESFRSVNELLDEESRASFKRSLTDLELVVHTLAARQDVIDRGVVAASQTLENTARVSAEVADLVARLRASAAAVQRMADEVARAGRSAGTAMESARQAVDAAGAEIRGLGSDSIPEVARLVVELRDLASVLGRVVQQLERDPSALVRGRAPAPPGPGE